MFTIRISLCRFATKSYIKGILEGELFCLNYNEIRILPCINPPAKETILQELQVIIAVRKLLPLGKITKHLCPDKDWLLLMLSSLDPCNKVFKEKLEDFFTIPQDIKPKIQRQNTEKNDDDSTSDYELQPSKTLSKSK